MSGLALPAASALLGGLLGGLLGSAFRGLLDDRLKLTSRRGIDDIPNSHTLSVYRTGNEPDRVPESLELDADQGVVMSPVNELVDGLVGIGDSVLDGEDGVSNLCGHGDSFPASDTAPVDGDDQGTPTPGGA